MITNRYDSQGLRLEKIGMQTSPESSTYPNPFVVAVWMSILAVIAPTSITVTHNGAISPLNLRYSLWYVTADKYEWAIMTSSYFAFFVSTIFVILTLSLRLTFGFQAMRYYQQATTRSRTLLAGVMSSFFEFSSFGVPPLTPYGLFVVPLPILFILGTLLLWVTEEPLIKPPPLRREPIIIFGMVMVFFFSSFIPNFLFWLIVILVISEYRTN